MKTPILAGAAMLAGASLAASANAASMAQLCKNTTCIYDANNAIIATADSYGPQRQIGGQEWYDIGPVKRLEITPELFVFYGSADCSGQPYISSIGLLPRTASYDGSAFFAPAETIGPFTWMSYAYPKTFDRGGQCFSYGPNCMVNGILQACQGTGAPATMIETVTFTPPFKVRYSPNLPGLR